MASIQDGLRPVVRTMVFPRLDEAQAEQDRTHDEAPEYRTRISGRTVKVDGCAVAVFVLVIRKPRVGPNQERARKKAARTCRMARFFVARTMAEYGEDRPAVELLFQAEAAALMLDGVQR